MFRQFINGIDGMDQYLIFSMIVFILFFVGVLIYVIRMKKADVDELANIPLSDSEISSHENAK